MPALANIVLNDGTVNHTFVPEGGNKNGIFTFVEIPSSGVYDHRSILTTQVVRQSAHRKVTVKLAIPRLVTNSDTGVTTVEGYDEQKTEYRFLMASDNTDRTEATAMFSSAGIDSVVASLVVGLEDYH